MAFQPLFILLVHMIWGSRMGGYATFRVVCVLVFALYLFDVLMVEIQDLYDNECYMSVTCYAWLFRLQPVDLLTFGMSLHT